jgi:hypothetical protein
MKVSVQLHGLASLPPRVELRIGYYLEWILCVHWNPAGYGIEGEDEKQFMIFFFII